MATYKCRNPFMSRIGQFEPGEHTLVCGILESVILKGRGEFVVQLGDSPTLYKILFTTLRDAKHTVWTNPRGKRVWIVPVSTFRSERKVVPIPPEPEKEKEPETLKLF